MGNAFEFRSIDGDYSEKWFELPTIVVLHAVSEVKFMAAPMLSRVDR